MESKLQELLKKHGLKSICFGPAEFHIYSENDLADAQLGYSRHSDGIDLSGVNEGDWRKEWVVFGYDGMLGDPYFTDVSDINLPVYTALHGVGSWSPEDISQKLENFLASLSYLSERSREDSARIIPGKNTVTDEDELREIELALNSINGPGDFWSDLIERHFEWLEESDY